MHSVVPQPTPAKQTYGALNLFVAVDRFSDAVLESLRQLKAREYDVGLPIRINLISQENQHALRDRIIRTGFEAAWHSFYVRPNQSGMSEPVGDGKRDVFFFANGRQPWFELLSEPRSHALPRYILKTTNRIDPCCVIGLVGPIATTEAKVLGENRLATLFKYAGLNERQLISRLTLFTDSIVRGSTDPSELIEEFLGYFEQVAKPTYPIPIMGDSAVIPDQSPSLPAVRAVQGR